MFIIHISLTFDILTSFRIQETAGCTFSSFQHPSQASSQRYHSGVVTTANLLIQHLWTLTQIAKALLSLRTRLPTLGRLHTH